MRNFFHTTKALTSYHVSSTLIVIENRNNGLRNRKLDFTRYAGKPLSTVCCIFALVKLILTAFVTCLIPLCDIESWGGVVVFGTQCFII